LLKRKAERKQHDSEYEYDEESDDVEMEVESSEEITMKRFRPTKFIEHPQIK
jgi:hypothetical protein